MRVAYIDEREETVNGKSQKLYYSVLVKGGDKLDEVCKNNLFIFDVFIFCLLAGGIKFKWLPLLGLSFVQVACDIGHIYK